MWTPRPRASYGPRLLASVVWAMGLVASRAAGAEPACPLAQIGQPCGGGVTTCVQATCSSPQPDGAIASAVCGVCTYVSGVYCLPADVGKGCGDGGVCTFAGGSSSGGGGNGSFTSYGLQTCTDPVDAASGGSSSGVLGPSCPSEDDGKPCDGGGVCTIYGGSSGTGSGGGVTSISMAACTIPGSGSSSGGSSGVSGSSTSGSSSGGTPSSSTGASSGGTGSSTGAGSASSSSGSSAGGGPSGGSGSAGSSSSGGVGPRPGDASDAESGSDANGGAGCAVSRAPLTGGFRWPAWLAVAGAAALLRRRRPC